MKKNILKLFTVLVGGLFLLASCQDLDVTNPNNPDTERALASASDVESLVGSQYQQWWNTQKNYPGMTLSVIGNASTASWGNFGMFDLGAFPRQAFQNDQSYSDIGMSTVIWSNAYTAISSVNDGLNALEAGIQFNSQNEMRSQRMEAFSRFIQGISYGLLANHYDQAFYVDENTDLEAVSLGNEELDIIGYEEVLETAIGFLDEAISLSNSSDFTLPEGWVRGNALSSADLALLAEAYKVRFITSNARSEGERDAINWTAVRDMAANVSDASFFDNSENAFTIQADGVFWWSRPHSLQQDGGWVRTDMMLIGHTDESGQFEDYATGAVTDRRQFTLTTSDRRIAGQEDVFDEEGELIGSAQQTARGTDFAHAGPAPPPAARGVWRFSMYHHHRNDEMYRSGFVGPMQHMRVTEMKMMQAEALLRLNEPVVLPEVVSLINETRVDRGGLDAISVADGWDDVFNAMRYEFEIETHATAAGIDYYHTRSWGNLKGKIYGKLLPGSPIHFPIPAGELELLELPVYTFGGAEGGAAPKGMPNGYEQAINAGNQKDVSKE